MAATGQVSLNFGTFPGATDAKVDVAGQTGITAGSLVEAWVFPATTAEHTADEHWVENLQVTAGNVAAGVGFTIYGLTLDRCRLYGNYNIAWVWS